MRRVFIDANVIIAVLNKEYPLFRFAARVLSLADQPSFELYTSATCLARVFYLSSKRNGEALAVEKIRELCKHIKVADSGQNEVNAALANKTILDFQDGMQYYAALHVGCQAIITENKSDFHFAEIPVFDSAYYLREIAIPLIHKKA